MSLLDVQARLNALGFDCGKPDGVWGGRSEAAVNAALDRLEPAVVAPPPLVPAVALQLRAARPVREIIVHCTATPEGRDVTAAEVRRWHKAQGWDDIGYHYLVRLDGTVEPGRPEAKVGAHVAGHNEGTLGVVYAGGVSADGKTPKDTRTDAQRKALMALCQALAAKYPGIVKISGHREYAAKACPSFDVRSDPLGQLLA